MFRLQRFTLFLFFSFSSLFGASLPKISSKDVCKTVEKICSGHVSHKSLSPSLMQRGLEAFLERLDPTKCYLLASEVDPYLNLDNESLLTIIHEAERGEFTTFYTIAEQMEKGILRRKVIDSQITSIPRPTGIKAKEFKNLTWAKDEEALRLRILRIEGLQQEATSQLPKEAATKALARIKKQRDLFEEDVTSRDAEQKRRFILTTTLRALASAFDAHTTYFTPAEAAQFMVQVQQRLFGIGAQLRDDLNGFTIMKILDAGPASLSDLRVKDRVIAIGKEPVVGLCITDAVELIRGAEGTIVVLTVLRETAEGEQKLDIEITRGEVVIKEARMSSTLVPFADGVIAILRLHSFYQDAHYSSAKDLNEAISSIKQEENLKGIVLDLRQNCGGLLPQAVAVTGLFITKGVVVSIKDSKQHIEHLREVDGKTVFDGPMIVLTSKVSASAAEIVAQTLQDYGRALVVGDEHTYGKGTFQTFTLDQSRAAKVNPKGEYKVTRGKYYTVSGKSPQLVGVSPDIVVPGPFSTLEIGERYAKNPLENDSIDPNFDDDLSDIPPYQREQITWFYRYNLQPKLTTFTKHLPQLKENAKNRFETQKIYQAYLEELDREEYDQKKLELFSLQDFQLDEGINILKDLIQLCSQ